MTVQGQFLCDPVGAGNIQVRRQFVMDSSRALGRPSPRKFYKINCSELEIAIKNMNVLG